MIRFLLPKDSAFTLAEYLESRGRGLAPFATILLYEDLWTKADFPAKTYVFGTLDQLYPEDRRALGRWAEDLRSIHCNLQLGGEPVRAERAICPHS